MIEQKSRRSFPLMESYGFLIEIYKFSLLKELCFLHRKVEVRTIPVFYHMTILTSHKKSGDEIYEQISRKHI